MSDEDLAVRMVKESSPAHLNRQRVRFSSIALSWERREKKKRCWRSDRDSLSLGRDKLKYDMPLEKVYFKNYGGVEGVVLKIDGTINYTPVELSEVLSE